MVVLFLVYSVVSAIFIGSGQPTQAAPTAPSTSLVVSDGVTPVTPASTSTSTTELQPKEKSVPTAADPAELYVAGDSDAGKQCFADSASLAGEARPTLFANAHAHLGIALLREADLLLQSGRSADSQLTRARKHLDIAMTIAEEEGDQLVLTDRIGALGAVAFLSGNLEVAERLLTQSIDRGIALDFVRPVVSASHYLARLLIRRGDTAGAVGVLRKTVSLARRGVTEDLLVTARKQLADALVKDGQKDAAENERIAADLVHRENESTRARSAVDAKQIAARILAAAH